ncbi:alpha/beta hydrolase [Nocardia amikacinitolerans]|uniref:alpha/beta hydrolase n=1 Tax=Nocardia amikacinitolerans TaxID=756689 RepID=UPI0020A5A918|nr:alpha/beta hydrolase [Nocardia amikacinitolerans]MCP2278154.1 alpha/beta hydrolase fold [Nocardia amikacinitolerans]
MRRWKFVLIVVAAAAPVLTACTAVQQATAVSELVRQADAAPTPRLDWRPCADADLGGLECATAAVPLNYAEPEGKTIELAVVRQLAADPERRIGTLFTAAGGPGGSGIDWARQGELAEGETRERFDVVTFDQRGIGRSAPVRCFADDEQRRRFWDATLLPPANAEQERAAEQAARTLAEGCAKHSGELLGHLTTVDAARDMDLLRRAVGEEKLTYAGGSYASYLGQVYGALFGERVRALQLSSMLDPRVYTDDVRAYVIDTAAGTAEIHAEFLWLCAEAGKAKCAFAGGSERSDLTGPAAPPERAEKAGSAGPERVETTTPTPADSGADRLRARDNALLERLRHAPITIGAGEHAVPVRYSEVVQAHALMLYDPERGWPALAELLIELERGPAGDPAKVREILAAAVPDYDFLDAFTAITCADQSAGWRSVDWPALSHEIASAEPIFGRFWLGMHQPCATWPAPEGGYPQRYTGPWTLGSDKPALLLNNRFDPVTPVTFAKRAQQELVNARLVVVADGYGHEPDGECVRQLRERYLVDLRLPAPGATCAADRRPFAS